MVATDLLEHTELDVPHVLAVQLSTQCAADPAAIGAAMQNAFAKVMPYMSGKNLAPSGPPRAIYTDFNAQQTRFTLAIPVASGAASEPDDGVSVGSLAGGRMHRFTHHGPYSALGKTYEAITSWMVTNGLMSDATDWAKCSPMWEEYVNDPRTTPAADLVTYIYLPATTSA